jgi:hypothetical protein
MLAEGDGEIQMGLDGDLKEKLRIKANKRAQPRQKLSAGANATKKSW